jgi:hypothetical protein
MSWTRDGVAARGRDFERALRRLLALDVLEIGHAFVAGIGRRLRPSQGLQSLEVVDELKQVLRGEDGHVGCGPCGLGPARSGTDQPLPERVRADGDRERASDGSDRSVERQLAEHAETFDRIAGNGAGRSHEPEHDRQVVMAAFLREVGGSEIDGDAFRRQREADGIERPAHPLAAFRYRLVGQPDDGEVWKPRSDLDLHVNGARLDALESDRGDTREHGSKTPVPGLRPL